MKTHICFAYCLSLAGALLWLMTFDHSVGAQVPLALGPGAKAPADLVIRNGKILTVDARSSTVEAVAIRDGVFVLVGSNAEIQKLIGDKTRVIDAQGRTVVPGLIESHVHAVGAARGEALQPFVQLGSIAEIQEWVRKESEARPAGTWIQTPRVDITRIRERRLPTRADLDAVAPKHPVVFTWQYASRVVQVLNSAALQAAKITRDTAEPKGGKIVIDDKGEPTGVVENVRDLVNKHIPPRDVPEEDHLKALERLVQRYHEVGITSIFERNSSVEGFRTYEKLKAKGRLSMRVVVTLGQRSDGTVAGMEKWLKGLPVKFGDGDDWLRIGPIKFFVDGGVLYGTAYLLEPWGLQPLFGITDPTYRGTLSLSKDKVENVIRAGHQLGWQMCSHVTGDGGVDVVLDALEAVHKDQPIDARRYTLIHAYFPNPKAVRRAAALGVCVDTQPAWYSKDADALTTALGERRLRNFIGLNDWRQGGVKVALNSDHMQGADPNSSLNPYNPFLTMYTAVTRKTESGLVVGPEHKVARADALRMMTLDAAYLSFDEKKKGSIEVGKLADLAILSDHLLTCDAERIKDIRAVATVVGGRVVHFTPQLSAEGAHQPQQEKRDAKTPLSDNRGLVRKRELEFRTASFHDSLDAIMKQIKTVAGAIVTTSDLEVLPNGKARARLVVRVPMERFDPFVLDLHRTLAKRAELTNDRTVTENVAKKQADLEARLRAARSMEVRISNLINYDKADKKDIAAAERELSAWQDKIKTMDQDKRRFDDLVALGTLAISLHEKDKSPVYRKFTAQKLEELLQEAKIEFDKDDGKSKETWHYRLEPRPRGSNLQIHLSNHEGLRLMIGVLFVGRISQKEVTEWNGRNRLSAVKYVKDRDPARSFFLEAMLDCEAGVTEADVLRFINRFDSEIKDFVEYLNK